MRGLFLPAGLIAFALGLAPLGDALSQSEDELRARQDALFATLVERPDDLAIMFDYAAVSMRLQDYEPAIATLERMLIFNPDLPRVKLELGVAYFRLGAYDVARFYFDDVLQGGPPDEVVARISPFIAAIEERTAQSSFTGFVSFGPVYSTNANLGPLDREIQVAAFPGGVGTLSEDAVEDSDVGLRFSAVLNHRYDLRRPNDDVWLTTAVYTGLRYRHVAEGEFDAFDIQTGPRLALDDRSFGPKARPFAQFGHVRSANDPLYVTGGGGVELTDTLSETLSAFGTFSVQNRNFASESSKFDGFYGFATGGVLYTGLPGAQLRGSLFYETDRVDEDSSSNHEFGARVAASTEFSVSQHAGFEAFPIPWRASVFGQASTRRFDEPDTAVDPDETRRDFDLRVGGRVVAPMEGGWAVAVDTSYFERESSIVNFELRNFEIGFSIIKTF